MSRARRLYYWAMVKSSADARAKLEEDDYYEHSLSVLGDAQATGTITLLEVLQQTRNQNAVFEVGTGQFRGAGHSSSEDALQQMAEWAFYYDINDEWDRSKERKDPRKTGCPGYERLREHLGHQIVISDYHGQNAAVECETCHSVLHDANFHEEEVQAGPEMTYCEAHYIMDAGHIAQHDSLQTFKDEEDDRTWVLCWVRPPRSVEEL